MQTLNKSIELDASSWQKVLSSDSQTKASGLLTLDALRTYSFTLQVLKAYVSKSSEKGNESHLMRHAEKKDRVPKTSRWHREYRVSCSDCSSMACEVPDNIFENLHEVLNICINQLHTSASSRLVLGEIATPGRNESVLAECDGCLKKATFFPLVQQLAR